MKQETEFSDNIKTFLEKEFDIFDKNDIDKMSLDELLSFKERVKQKREEYALVEFAYKTCANAAYGSCGNEHFYFYNPDIAASITSECRVLTKYMWDIIPQFLKEDIWDRKDLWKLCDFELDESKHDWLRQQKISVQSDTDSTYVTYEPFFKAMTPEYQEKYATDEAKVIWILNFYKKFMDGQQRKWCEDLYNPRHGKNVHEFELELICKSVLGLAKKKYVKGVVYEKGHFMIDNPKLKSTGVEIVRSSTPSLIRKFMKELVDDFLYNYDSSKKEEFIYYINHKLKDMYAEFKSAPIDDIAQSVSVGDYKKYVIDDVNGIILEKRAPFSVKAAVRYNYLARKNGRADLVMKTGKIKFYNIRTGQKKDDTDYFGYPIGELPDFAPPIDYQTQWQKTLVEPINRFLTALEIPMIAEGTNCIQNTLFGF